MGRRITAFGILIWAAVAVLTGAHYAREIPTPEGVTAKTRAKQLGVQAVPEIRVVRGTIKIINERQIVLQASGTPSTDYAFGLSDTIIRRGENTSSLRDLVQGETVGVLYVESDRGAVARMILAPRIDTSSLTR